MLANDAIHGWSPPNGDDEDVNVSQDLFFMTIQSLSSPDSLVSPICPPLEITPTAASPSSQSSPLVPLPRRQVPNPSMAPSSDRRAQRNRNRDPSWIPRPRNAFIIFRCEYSREHSQGPRDSADDDEDADSGTTIKTLSKRAAEAWKKLPASERERYKVMADQEREEHARLYPNYRFRPMKRQTQATKKASSEDSKASRSSSAERLPTPSTHVPSVLSSAPEKTTSSVSLEPSKAPVPVPAMESLPVPQPYLADPQPPLLQLDLTNQFPYYPLPETPSFEPYSAQWSVSPDTFSTYDPSFSFDQTKEDLERAQALEAYSIGLHNFDLFSPFSFQEYY